MYGVCEVSWVNAPQITPERWGFVYEIKELGTGKIYVGCKRFWNKVRRKPLKGRRNKRNCLVESDWRSYNSSSRVMQDNIKNNPGNYAKTIIRICDSQTELKCWEAFTQLGYYVIDDWDKLFNEVINLRMRVRKDG